MSLAEQLRDDSLTMVCASCCYVALVFAIMCLYNCCFSFYWVLLLLLLLSVLFNFLFYF